jgi:anti-anti-sigma regulatory factor
VSEPADTIEPVRSAVREAIARAARPFSALAGRDGSIADELEPFIECADRAARQGEGPDGLAWREARSMAWLFAHRMGDQAIPAAVVTAGVIAWRDAVRTDSARAAFDAIAPLLVEGYARGREEHATLVGQRALAEAAPVRELEPGFLYAIAAGPMDADGAQSFADRVSRDILRRDARVVLLDVSDLEQVTPAVLAELWAVATSGRTLGARVIVAGVRGVVSEVLSTAGLHDEGELRVPLVADGMRAAREALEPPAVTAPTPPLPWWRRWLERKPPAR